MEGILSSAALIMAGHRRVGCVHKGLVAWQSQARLQCTARQSNATIGHACCPHQRPPALHNWSRPGCMKSMGVISLVRGCNELSTQPPLLVGMDSCPGSVRVFVWRGAGVWTCSFGKVEGSCRIPFCSKHAPGAGRPRTRSRQYCLGTASQLPLPLARRCPHQPAPIASTYEQTVMWRRHREPESRFEGTG